MLEPIDHDSVMSVLSKSLQLVGYAVIARLPKDITIFMASQFIMAPSGGVLGVDLTHRDYVSDPDVEMRSDLSVSPRGVLHLLLLGGTLDQGPRPHCDSG